MLALFYIFIGVAIGVSFWQITRIMNFRSVIATDKDNNFQGKMFLGFAVILLCNDDLLLNLDECCDASRICLYRR